MKKLLFGALFYAAAWVWQGDMRVVVGSTVLGIMFIVLSLGELCER